MTTERQDITALLHRLKSGDRSAINLVFEAAYPELKKIARGRMKHEDKENFVSPTALVHDLYLRMAGKEKIQCENRGHFLATAAQYMRWMLVDRARARARSLVICIEDSKNPVKEGMDRPRTVDLLVLEEAMQRLRELAPDAERMAELKIFAGVTTREAAEALEIPYHQARREWEFAKGWLKTRLNLS